MKKIKSRKFRIIKQILFKVWLFLLGLFIIFYCSNVKAGMNDSVIEKNRIDGVYAVSNVNGEERIFYLNMYELNGRIAYCIELGVDITTDIYHSTNDFSFSYLNDEQRNYIRLISYYGYGYEGHDDYRYYMAAQEIIWEYLGSNDVEWINELKFDGERIDIEEFKNDILRLIELDNVELNFSFEEGQAFYVGDELILVDSNEILKNYEVSSSKYSNVFIDGNKLVIKVGNHIGEEEIILRRKGYYDYDSLLYYYDNSQRLVSNGNYEVDEYVINFNIKGISLTGIVVDMETGMNGARGDGSLIGATYEIYDEFDNLIGVYESNSNAKFKVNNLLIGTYYIKQIKASEGYLMNEKKFKIDLTKENKEIKLPQLVMYNHFEITKLYGENGNYRPENMIMFEVLTSDNKLHFYLFTDKLGKVDFRLPYGRYKFSQRTTTAGYAKIDDFYIEVSDNSNEVIYYTLIDELVRIDVRVNTFLKDNLDKILLDGFSYRIRKRDDNTYLEIGGNSIFSSINGEVFIPSSLSYGDYILEQVSVPNDIYLNNEMYEFSIDENTKLSLEDNKLVLDINIYNELIRGSVEVKATEEVFYKDFNNYGYNIINSNNKKLSLISNEDIVINGQVIYEVDTVVYNGYTDIEGVLLIDNLYLGSYCLIDNENNNKKCFELVSSDNKTKLVDKKIDFVSELNKRNITVFNKDNEGNDLTGSIFEVIDNNKMIIYTGSTNDNGIIKVDNLLPGNYCIRQKKVLGNYQDNKEEKCILLENDMEVNFINDIKLNEVIVVPDTFSEDIGFYEVLLILVLIGVVYLVYKKIFISKLYR